MLRGKFETYVKAKDLDLWHIIWNGDFPLLAKNEFIEILEVVPFEEQSDNLKKKLAKNNEAKMVLYNDLPKKECERIFVCKTAKDIWQSLLITHQEESIDSGFARFNTIITSLKALDEGYSSKNYVRKFIRALHPKWRAKVTSIEESKDLSSLALDEFIGNLKVQEVIMEKGSEIYRGKKERVKSIALKAKKESSDDKTSTSGSDEEEYAMAVRNFKKFFRRKCKFVRKPREEKKSFRQRDEKKGKSDWNCFRCGDPNHLIGDCPKTPHNKDQKAFIGGSRSDSENDAEDKTNDGTCLMAQSSNEVKLNSSYYSDNASSLDNDNMQIEYDSLCEISSNLINKNKTLKTKRDFLEKEILELNEKIKKLERGKEIDIACSSIAAIRTDHGREFDNEVQFEAYCDAQGITHNFSVPRTPQSNGVVERKNRILQEMSRTMLNEQSIPQKFWRNAVDTSTYILNIEESLNVTFDKSPPPTKLSPLVDDDVGQEEAIRNNTKLVNNSNEEDESIEVDEVINIKESKNHLLDQVIGNLNQRTLRSQAQNHSNFFYFISNIEPKDIKEALKDESWVVAMQEELNQFVANDV
ncbi:zf-CCHC domain-containing protein [Tanacetum coccineum]|uniref:Zf-CCHC domain-containing protein n=1 Tax=Tanacetum coccineum TaxID=301880 RepID=A0ABQ4X5V1_9ASTR